jgi:hypothetical protein
MASSAARLIDGCLASPLRAVNCIGRGRSAGFDADSVVVYRGFVFSHFLAKRVSATVPTGPETWSRTLGRESLYCS